MEAAHKWSQSNNRVQRCGPASLRGRVRHVPRRGRGPRGRAPTTAARRRGGLAARCVLGRRSIPARVAASGAGTLLLVVLAVSVAMSAVLSSNVQREGVRRTGDRARAVAGIVEQERLSAVKSATLLAATLRGNT